MSYDLLTRDWLPVRTGDSRQTIGLLELFERAHELTDIQPSPPPAASGLWRVLTVIAARVTGLDNVKLTAEAWGDLQAEVLQEGHFDADKVSKYFSQHPGRFDLFDERRPWLQDPRLRTECKSSSGVNKLVMSRAAGNNQVWFDPHDCADATAHSRSRSGLPAADAAVLRPVRSMHATDRGSDRCGQQQGRTAAQDNLLPPAGPYCLPILGRRHSSGV
ncbi:hypothetical protein GCM10020219_002140 [Nonomuraea dietziae]